MMLYTAGNIEETVHLASLWNIEGLIVLGCKPSDVRKIKQQMELPVVFIDSYYEDHTGEFHNVGLDDFGGGYQMTKYLIHRGHRRIAFLADEENPVGVDRERLRGYQKALEECGITYQQSDYIPISYKKVTRHSILWEFSRKRIKDFTALFFASDFYASDAIFILQAQGIRVPEDISVVGFDDNVFAEHCSPMLTTVQQSVEDKGYYAFHMLYRLMKGEACENNNIHLPTKLVVRESVKNMLPETDDN